ncbi:ATP-binding protein [Aestuariirhabdus sp. Z084]|uniref:ATP-binding protein n=1 Tax=Aestuariirhabdus haliotis TaxID=2918751 RepID=UPI00201B3B52|nr:ATP-binding protein [Aestuariirhabdus haliotis]MCL6417422.1 ATP-binding protein [Aestuariirhabdus haliotis]MCL6421366.1 ATP-binding protein [Aestuariirhabdus haliotis]
MIAFAPRANLQRLCIIRALFIGSLLLALIWAQQQMELLLNFPVLGSILLVCTLMTVATLWRLRATAPVTQAELFGQLLFDVCTLSLIFFFSGGATNPFISFYLVPLSITAATLAWPYATAMLLFCLLCYGGLLFFYVPLAELYPQIRVQGNLAHMAQLHVIGMWLTFVVSALLITIFVVRMASALRLKQQELASHREHQLRNEQLMAVATQAAGAAHELGTPLSTMRTLLREMEQDHPNDQTLMEDIKCLQEQIGFCKSSLRTLVDQSQTTDLQTLPTRQVLTRLLDRWQLMRPEARLQLELPDAAREWAISWDPTLDQALLNLLNNAADQSPEIILEVQRQKDTVLIRVRDFGQGISAQKAEHLGELFYSDKREGLGIGFSLSQATIERLGGQVRLYPHSERGTITEVQLPVISVTTKH